MKPAWICGAAMALSVGASSMAQVVADDSGWDDLALPYRMTLKLSEPVSGASVVDLDLPAMIDAFASVSVDPMDAENFAFERTRAVDPSTGETIGRFVLTRVGEPIPIDGSFTGLATGDTPWLGYLPDKMKLMRQMIGGKPRAALVIRKDQIANHKLNQPVNLKVGHTYLLEYWFMMDTQDNLLGVMMYDNNLPLFGQLDHSYASKSPPRGEWGFRQVLFQSESPDPSSLAVRPDPEDAYMSISHAMTGTGGVSQLRLQEVQWRLFLESDKPVQDVVLYTSGRAGHRFTSPTPDLVAEASRETSAVVQAMHAERVNLNPDAVLVETNGLTAWTLDPHLPLRTDAVKSYQPSGNTQEMPSAARIHLFRGGSVTLLIALDTGEPRLGNVSVESNLPAATRFDRLATIPAYDGPTVDGQIRGKLLGNYYEAMVPLDYQLDPDSSNGVHVLAATISADRNTPVGHFQSQVTVKLERGDLVIPIELDVAPLTVQPSRHFGTTFAGNHLLTRYHKGVGPFTEDSVTVAEYHGFDARGLEPPSMISLSIPDRPNSKTTPGRHLAEKYFHRMLDFHLQPESPALYAYFTYDIEDRGPGKAPALSNWDFSGGFDEAIDDFVIGRDMPRLVVGRSNGYLMNHIRLSNGKAYSTQAKADDPNWVQLSKDEYLHLVADYWDQFAKHLDDKGVLDRAMFVIDECGPETFDTILEYVRAVRSRPYGEKIRFGHTAYKPAVWNYRKSDGQLIMDEILDIPMADNDDEFNFFETEWHERFERPKQSWVYYVETDHMNLQNTGLSTVLGPLKLRHLGIDGWYCWASFIWSIPYPYENGQPGSFGYTAGPVINPWMNPYYHHGPGQLSFFYPPDPKGPATQPTDLVIPSYRLALMRDGIQMHALMDVLERGVDDSGQKLRVDREEFARLEDQLSTLWADNPVQWYLAYRTEQMFRQHLFTALHRSVRHDDAVE